MAANVCLLRTPSGFHPSRPCWKLLVVCGLLIGLVLASAAIWFVTTLRQQDIDDTAREMKNLALILAEETDRSFQAAELVQLGLIEHLRELGIDSPERFERHMASLDVHRDLKGRIAGVSHIAALALVDRQGNLINFTRSWPPPKVNDADRDFVRDLLVPDALPWLVSGLMQSKISGNWTIYLSRRATAPDGQLIGIVVATIETNFFEQFFAKISLDAGASFVLYRRDGTLLARYPRIDDKIGRSFGHTPNFNRLISAHDGGVVRLTSAMDGKERLATPHGVAHYPLLIEALAALAASHGRAGSARSVHSAGRGNGIDYSNRRMDSGGGLRRCRQVAGQSEGRRQPVGRAVQEP
jgi:hypothetical protein